MVRTGHEARDLIVRGGVDVVQCDAVLTEGFEGCRRLSALADAHGRSWSPHTWSHGHGLLANLHLALAVSACPFLEVPFDPPAWTPERRDFPLPTPVEVAADGALAAPPGAGPRRRSRSRRARAVEDAVTATEPLVLTGFDLTAGDVADVARAGRRVELAPEAVERMALGWDVVREAVRTSTPVYGLTTGVGAHKRVSMDAEQLEHFNLLLLPSHRVGQGPYAPADVVRAALLRLVNGFASGTTGVRPELAAQLVEALNAGRRRACGCSARSARRTSLRWPTSRTG